ncbi:MAG: universal stress protein [Bacteroidales bacterium]|nr:universal stress protein [Bacteroidales bacterium]
MEDKIVTVAKHTYSRAQLLKGRLESEGIECFLTNINLIQPDIASGVRVRINEKDLEKALRIIEEIKLEYGKDKEGTLKKLKNVRRILVPIDFSDCSVNACQYAIGLAEKLKAEIKLLYAYYSPIIEPEAFDETYTYQVNLEKILLNIETEAKQNIEELTKNLKDKIKQDKIKGVKVNYSLVRGSPDDAILDFNETYNPGIIIMGTKGKGEKTDDIIGSVTTRIIEKAKIPVLVIPENSIFNGIENINNIVYATDFDDSDFKAIRKLMSLVRPFNMKIYCVHIGFDPKNVWDKVKMESLEEHFNNEYKDYDIVCNILENKDILKGLEDFILDKKIDIISLTTHKRGIISKFFKPSLTRKMLFHTDIPVLVFHS